MPRPLRVFLCHASQDKPAVRELYNALKSKGWIDPWLDKAKILPGQDWEMVIEKAVDASDVVIIFLSNQSVTKEGFVQREIRYAYDLALEKPEDTIFLIPLRLDDCPVPRKLRTIHWVDYFGSQKRTAYSDLLEALQVRYDQKIKSEDAEVEPNLHVGRVSNPTVAAPRDRQAKSPTYPVWAIAIFAVVVISLLIWGVSQLTTPRATPEPPQTDTTVSTNTPPVATEILPTYTAASPIAIEIPPTYTAVSPTMTPSLGMGSLYDSNGVIMLYVPAGTFSMGSEVNNDEKPIHPVDLAAYYIDKFEVTNTAYKRCVDAGACVVPKQSNSPTHPAYYGNPEFDEYPVIYVDWNMAKTYCEWRDARLPTEAEWEKAARGTDGRTYPWGESIDCEKANYQSGCAGDTKQVGSYLGGVSPYGAYDMAGNVWEWVNDWYDGTYYQSSPSSNPLGPDTGSSRVLRGGSWVSYGGFARSAYRFGSVPAVTAGSGIGFRCSRSP